MLRKRCSKTSRHRKKYSPAPLTVTTRPRGLERPRRRRRSEPFSTPKRHFLTENGRPARPLEDPSCTQRQAGKVEPRAWEAQAEPCSMECIGTSQLELHLHLETPAKGHFDISSCHGAPAEPRKQRSECTRNQPCPRAARVVLCIGRKPERNRCVWLTELCASAVSREAGARR